MEEILFKGYEDEILAAVCEKPLLRTLCGGIIPDRIGVFYKVRYFLFVKVDILAKCVG